MDWALAIKRNRDQLKDLVLALFVLAKMRVGGSLFTLPRSTIAMIMLVLRPAEACVRRLIVIAAHGLKLKPHAAKKCSGLPSHLCGAEGGRDPWLALAGGGGAQPTNFRAFQLFDPLKHFDPDTIWDAEPTWESGYHIPFNHGWHEATIDHTPIDASHIGQRLNALMRALDNIPAQARRLVRWQARRDAAIAAKRSWTPRRMSPMRPGLPPGWRERKVHEIDTVLRECHGLANDLLNAPDSS